MKLIGAVMVLVACTLVGFEFAKRLSERTRQLRQLKAALRSLEAEIMYSHRSVGEASVTIAAQIPKPLSMLFTLFADKLEDEEVSVKSAWFASVEESWGKTALKKPEIEILKQFGETLGQHDRYSQQKHILLALNHLEREEADAVDQQNRYERMMKSIGFLAGLLLIILLM